jgi:hypothetical protein
MSRKNGAQDVNVTTTIDAVVHAKESLFLRLGVGTAKDDDGGNYELSVDISAQAPIVRVPDGRWVTFPWQALVPAAKRAAKESDAKARGGK